ncbi:MAG: HAMP domain-containing histidine kinase [Saprospiraceae bacterium]|jgi:two-component system phosphate regulon sensor histidine kinase PhoR|nr:HAMP domain-containing histidine kinase [Saprospiraceae bacterium]
MKNTAINRVVVLGALAIIGIIAIQAYLLMNTWNAEEKDHQEKVSIALQGVAKEFEKLGSTPPAYNIISQVTTNYWVVNINDDINPKNLEHFLRLELESIGLREDFEYGIYDCDSRKMVYGKYIDYDAKAENPKPIAAKGDHMPVHEEYQHYFGIRFPNRNSQILSNMRLTLIFSGILLVTILFFLYAISIILRQKRLSEMQKDFINNMTHEFKTPISTIRISTDVFLKSPEIMASQRLTQYANIIQEQNSRLNNQVEKVLQLAKIERDNFQLNLEETDLHGLVQGVLDSIRVQVEKQGGALHCELLAKSPIIKADKLHLTNILHNLVDNATKYCKDTASILLKTQNIANGKIQVQVIDNGIGISKEDLGKVFEKFYRVPTGNVHNVKGFGLGLFYTKNICEAHGWKIGIESELGKGTTVTIII